MLPRLSSSRLLCSPRALMGGLRRRQTAPGAASNWAENVAFSHTAFRCPETVNELQDVVAAADKLRVLGSGHSFSSLCRTDDTMVSLAFMRNVLGVEVGETDMSIQVEGGATLGDVIKYLAPRGFALKNIPSLPHITIAGALATATHGSGLQPGAEAGLPSMCNAIEFVTHDGNLVAYERGQPGTSPSFSSAVVHLGALGVVSRVSLDVVPSFTVDQRVYTDVNLDILFANFEDVARSVDSLTVGINFGVQKGMLWMRYFEREDGLGTPPPQPSEALCEQLLTSGAKLRMEPVPFYESQRGVKATRRGPWHDVPSFFMDDGVEVNMPRVALQSEYFVPLSSACSALQAVREIASKWEGWPVSEAWEDLNEHARVLHCEVRVIPADGLSGLSPYSDRDTCSIHFTWGGWEHRDPILQMVQDIEAALRPFNARPHFGKLNLFSANDLRAVYLNQHVDSFFALCDKHDPRGKFMNSLLLSQLRGEYDVKEQY